MLKISAQMKEDLSRAHMFSKVTRFLVERTKQPNILKVLSDTQSLNALWSPFWPRIKDQNEHIAAATLIYLLILHCQGEQLEQSLVMIEQQENTEFLMKRYFSQHSDLRFSELDLVEKSETELYNREV